MGEVWKSVGTAKGVNYSGLYEVSTFGNVKSIDRVIISRNKKRRKFFGTLLKQYQNDVTGYMQVCLYCNGKPNTFNVHELVMNVFNPNPSPEIYTDINHKDENKLNNRLDNLEWATHKENVNYSLKDRFIPIVQLDFSGDIINVYYSVEEMEKTNTFAAYTIGHIMNKQDYIYKNYFWIRLDKYNDLAKENLMELISEKVTIKETKLHKSSNKPIMQFSKNGKFIREYPSIVNAAKEMGCTKQAIQQCVSGKCETCKGYKWEYK